MEEILIIASIIAPVTSGIVQAIKKATNVNENLLPIVAVLVGIILGILATFLVDVDLGIRMWAGAISGLASTGLFELSKNVKDEVENG